MLLEHNYIRAVQISIKGARNRGRWETEPGSNQLNARK